MSYFVISNFDGDTHVREYSQDALAEMLEDPEEGAWLTKAFDSAPDDTDTNYWGGEKVLIIKGEVVVPTPVERVSMWVLP